MATTRHHNITGEISQELLKPGANYRVSKVSLANVEGSTASYVDLWMEKQYNASSAPLKEPGLYGKFYFIKKVLIPAGASLICDLSFDNSANEFGLYIKLTQSASETPAMDVILY